MATTKKQAHWIARYAFKTDGKLNGIVTYAVRSSNGKDIYCTTFIEGKASGCSCPSRTGSCYHRTQLAAREALRKPVTSLATKQDDNMTVQVTAPVVEVALMVVEPVKVAPAQEYRMSEGVYEKLKAIADAKVEEPKQTFRIVAALDLKRERRDLVQEITEKREMKQDMLAEIREIQERAKSSDIGQRGALNNAPQTTQMPEWLAILPSRRQHVATYA